MNINLTNIEKEMLKKYALNYEEDRKKDFTLQPIVVVKTKKSRPADKERSRNPYLECYIPEWEFSTTKKEELFEELMRDVDMTNELANEIVESIFEHEEDYTKLPYSVQFCFMEDYYEPVAYFFSRKEAELYCKYQKHNLNDPIVYTECWGYQNKGDFPIFQKLLLKMGNQILEMRE